MKQRQTENLWALYPQTNKLVYKPGESLKINLTVENLSDSSLYFSQAQVAPSWAEGEVGIKPIEVKDYLPGHASMFLTTFNMTLPQQVGLYTLKFGLETWVYNYYTVSWENLGVLWTSDWGYIQVTPTPTYTAFVTRSNRPEDTPIVEQIETMIQLWGFEPHTVGIDIFSEDPLKVPAAIEQQISQSAAVIAIATPRDYSLQENLYQTFPWFHIETGMAFRSDKPLLFIVDERIKLEGLLEYPNFPKVHYHPAKLEILEHRLAVVMPSFRKWISDKKSQEFQDALIKAGLVLGGISLVALLTTAIARGNKEQE